MNTVVQEATRTPQRFTYEHRQTMGYPLVTLGSKVANRVSEGGISRLIDYKTIGWKIDQTKAEEVDIPGPLVYDVLYGLIYLLAQDGFPDDGVVRFSRYNLMQMIGWVANGRGGIADRKAQPSTRQYKQLRDACYTLKKTTFIRDEHGRSRAFDIVSMYDIQDDPPGRKKSGADMPRNSVVRFNPEFLEMLRDGIKLDLDKYLGLYNRTTRVLFRTLNWMQAEGIRSISIEALFERVGSTQRRCIPSMAQLQFDKAHAELVENGILNEMPKFEMVEGDGWYINYAFATPTALPAENPYVREALAFGVRETMAKELSIAHPVQFRRVVAAVSAGYLQASKSIAGMIVTYTRNPHFPLKISEPPADIQEDAPIHEQYRRWAAAERTARALRQGIDASQLRQDAIAAVQGEQLALVEGELEWLSEGMVSAQINCLTGIPTLAEYELNLAAYQN